jgi:hypothetical protein
MTTAVRGSPQTAPASPLTRRVLASDPVHGPLPPLLLALTAVTGLVDAVSILRLGRVFVASMTGNVVFTGFAIVGAPGFSLSASLFALAGFLADAAMGGMLASRAGHDRALLLLSAAASELIPGESAAVRRMRMGIRGDGEPAMRRAVAVYRYLPSAGWLGGVCPGTAIFAVQHVSGTGGVRDQ